MGDHVIWFGFLMRTLEGIPCVLIGLRSDKMVHSLNPGHCQDNLSAVVGVLTGGKKSAK